MSPLLRYAPIEKPLGGFGRFQRNTQCAKHAPDGILRGGMQIAPGVGIGEFDAKQLYGSGKGGRESVVHIIV
jgi:hypothetical protein